jgi:long-chain acyl-CoA synthetase
MLVHHLLEEAVSRHSDKIYIANEERSWTYREFFDATNSIALFLNTVNVGRGDRVIVSLENRAEAFQMVLGIMSAGAIAVPLAPTLSSNKLKYIIGNCQPKIFCGGKSLNILRETVTTDSLKHVVVMNSSGDQSLAENVHKFQEIVSQDITSPIRCAAIDLDPAMIIYTSGSTGKPKGITCSHLNILSATQSITTYLRLACDDRIINFQPFFFDYGLYQAFLTALVGASLYLERNFMYPTEILNRINRDRITVVPFVPTNITTLFSRDLSYHEPLPTVRIITNTGAAFPAHLINDIRSLFPEATIFSMYGLTECKRVSYLPPDQIDLKPNSVGIPMPNTEVWLVGEDDEKVGIHDVGQLVVRGSNVTLGYWGDQEGSIKTFRVQPNGERWLYTGDYFTQDRDGYLYFVGRRDDLLKVGGYRTSTKEVEATLAELTFVQEAAAIPIVDEKLGSSTKAFLVLKPTVSMTENQVRQHCQSAFESSTLVPKIIEIVSRLPRTPSGKVDYESLVERS